MWVAELNEVLRILASGMITIDVKRTGFVAVAAGGLAMSLALALPASAQTKAEPEPPATCTRLEKDVSAFFERGVETTIALPGDCLWALDGGQGKVSVQLVIEVLESDTEARKRMHFARLEQGEGLTGLGGGGFLRREEGALRIEAIKDRRYFKFIVRVPQSEVSGLVQRQALMFAGTAVNGRF